MVRLETALRGGHGGGAASSGTPSRKSPSISGASASELSRLMPVNTRYALGSEYLVASLSRLQARHNVSSAPNLLQRPRTALPPPRPPSPSLASGASPAKYRPTGRPSRAHLTSPPSPMWRGPMSPHDTSELSPPMWSPSPMWTLRQSAPWGAASIRAGRRPDWLGRRLDSLTASPGTSSSSLPVDCVPPHGDNSPRSTPPSPAPTEPPATAPAPAATRLRAHAVVQGEEVSDPYGGKSYEEIMEENEVRHLCRLAWCHSLPHVTLRSLPCPLVRRWA